MSTPLIDKSFEGMLAQMRREIALLWRRIGKSGATPSSGTTAERNALFGVPASDPDRVALANKQITWFNTDKGWFETYYAVTGLSGLSVRGLIAGTASNWYPVPGSLLTCTRIQQNGFQNVGAGGIYGATFLTIPTVNIGGFISVGGNQIQVPFPAFYDIDASVYFSGGGAAAYLATIVQASNAGGVFTDVLSARTPGGAADAQIVLSESAFPLVAGAKVAVGGQSSVNNNIYGDGLRRVTYLTLTYRGPALAND